MARENQDLQIALIVSVMLTIILGVATFLCYRQYTDTAKSLKTAQEERDKKTSEADTARNEVSQLKRIIGAAETEPLASVDKQFNDDMKKYGAGLTPETQSYRPLMAKLIKEIDDQKTKVKTYTDENKQWQDKYETREASKDAQMKEFLDTIARIKQDLGSQTETFRKDRERITEDSKKINDQLQTARKETSTAITKLEDKLQKIETQSKKISQVAKNLREENANLTNNVMDKPDGEIRWVNQRNGTVWIDIGTADNLNALTTFAVYSSDINNLGKSEKKGDIEVTQLIGDHLAEARILEDKTTDPIMPGDKIHTPVWNPGDKRHFALAGFMDVNGDGKNNLKLLNNLIVMNGGVIDCEVDEKGKRTGDLSTDTRYLIQGENPGEKGDTNAAAAYTKMLSEADSLGIQKIHLKELLQRMGYKPQAQVVNFGSDANSEDFKPKSENGINRVSHGSVSDIYKPKESSRSRSGGAY